MRKLLFCLVLISFVSFAKAQPAGVGYSFKGNYLGMPLATFKSQNDQGVIWINTGKPNMLGHSDKKLTREVKTPLCTDEMRDFPGDPRDLVDDEVVCNASPGIANPEGRMILDINLDLVRYRFYKGRLYAIEIAFSPLHYADIREGFLAKYGKNPTVRPEHFQNGFGANWDGELLNWMNGTQSIELREGSANGPGQDQFRDSHPSIGYIFDMSLYPPNHKQHIDF